MALIFLPSTRNTKAYLNITIQVIQSFLTFRNVCFGPSFVPKPGTVFYTNCFVKSQKNVLCK